TNLLHYFFLNKKARTHLVDWEARAGRVTAEFRADAGPYIGDPMVRAEIDEMLTESPVFAYWWTRHTVVDRDGDVLRIFRKKGNAVQSLQDTFRLMRHPDCKLSVLIEDAVL